MEMKVDPRRIRSEREKRAWSQEHLATVTGLGLRTVQRIETTGRASYESVAALSAVLSVPVAELRVAGDSRLTLQRLAWWLPRGAAAALAASVLAGLTVFSARDALAEQVMLDIEYAINEEGRWCRLLTEEGGSAEILMDGLLKFVLVPRVDDHGGVMLEAAVYEFDGAEYVLLSKPRLASPNHGTAEIRLGTDAGNAFRFTITSHVQ